ncbi:MAG: hypothetical protein MUF87_18045 [Anaerolineae bacterium]|jgi:hypothetical protein|nr:hypothetical protein [Anaerolineae bacterium]
MPRTEEPNNLPPDHLGILIAAAILFVIGWGGLYLLVTTEIPRIAGQLWIFFVLFHLGVTAITIPIVRYLNVRLTPINQAILPGGIVVRQSVWVGLYVVICAWLQIPRVLTLPVALLLALVFIVIEVFLRNREINLER